MGGGRYWGAKKIFLLGVWVPAEFHPGLSLGGGFKKGHSLNGEKAFKNLLFSKFFLQKGFFGLGERAKHGGGEKFSNPLFVFISGGGTPLFLVPRVAQLCGLGPQKGGGRFQPQHFREGVLTQKNTSRGMTQKTVLTQRW